MKNNIICIITLTAIIFSYPSKKEFSEAFINVATKGNPSVVSIISETENKQNYYHFFEQFNFPEEQYRNQSLGSGVIIDPKKGYIITNNHVIKNAKEIKVISYDRIELKANLIGSDPLSDIAILQVDSNALIGADIGNSENLQVGEWVVAIGSPFGLHLNHTVTAGIVSAIGRNDVISRSNFEDFIQHDAAINPGNSGGALFNLEGKLIGINTAIATDGFSRANAGVGFAIPINMVKRVMGDLINNGVVTRGWLGVQIQDLTENMAKVLNLNNKDGVIISQVILGSPAEYAGIENQDVIVKVDKKNIYNSSQLKNIISSGRPNENVNLTLMRNGIEKSINVTLGTRPDQNNITDVYNNNQIFDKIGLLVEEHNIDINNNTLATQKQIIINRIRTNSIAEKNQLKIGDIILQIGKVNIENLTDYKSELDRYSIGETIMFRLLRNKIPIYIAFEIE